jgi:Tol biopolymer transport system component
LWARRLNLDTFRPEGELAPVAPHVNVYADFPGYADLSASAAGAIAYRPGGGKNQLEWLDRTGRSVGLLGAPEGQWLLRVSPDGRTVLVNRTISGDLTVWSMDIERGVSRRITPDPLNGANAIFSPDGSRIAYVSDNRFDVYEIFTRSADATGAETPLLQTGENLFPKDWSRDGKFLSYASQSPQGNLDVWAVPLDGARTPIPVARTKDFEDEGRFSPDGHWIAIISNETGQYEVYVQAFPAPGPKTQVSIGGGSQPRWGKDGRELFYWGSERRLMVVPMTLGPTTVHVGTARVLFTFPEGTDNYEPAPDGQRFLINRSVSPLTPISVILNWKPPAR